MAIVAAVAVPHPPLIVPAVGRGEQTRIQATIDAYATAVAALLEHEPDCLVITSPHAPLFRDAFHVTTDMQLDGSMVRFGAPHERICAPCDVQLAGQILDCAHKRGIPVVDSSRYPDDMDHATYVPLYFVREALRAQGAIADDESGFGLSIPIVRVGLSGLSPRTHREMGAAIAQAAEALGRRVGFIASGDLSHKLLAEGPYGLNCTPVLGRANKAA